MSHVTPEELDRSLRRVKKYVDDNIVSGSGSGGTSIDIDTALSDTSENPVQNKVVKAALDGKANAGDIPDVSGFASLSDIPDVSGFANSSDLANKQDALTFDNVPTEDSTNPVTSGGVYSAIQSVSEYTLPIASASILGGIKVGAGLQIDANGVLSIIGFQKLPGYATLSSTAVVLDEDNKSATVSVSDSSGPVTVSSSNESIASATISENVITITSVGDIDGSADINVVIGETVNYSANTIQIHVDCNFAIEIVSWADGTEKQIKKMLESHYAGGINIHDYWNVGDERVVSIGQITYQGAGNYTLVLVDDNGYQLTDDNSKRCAFIWQQKTVTSSGFKMGSYTGTELPTNYAMALCSNYYNALPEYFKELCKSSSVVFPGGARKDYKVFIPSRANYIGSSTDPDNEDYRFTYYHSASPVKTLPNGSTATYWTSTPSPTNSAYYYRVDNNGGVESSSNGNNSYLFAAPAGCI